MIDRAQNTKTCCHCKRTLTTDDFYTNSGTRDGLRSRCKECSLDQNEKYRNHEYMRNYRREHREAITAAERRWKARNPAKVKAHRMVLRAVRSGRLGHGPCLKCGSADSFAHHDDYAKPLDVVWLCRDCHAERHRKYRRSSQSDIAIHSADGESK